MTPATPATLRQLLHFLRRPALPPSMNSALSLPLQGFLLLSAWLCTAPFVVAQPVQRPVQLLSEKIDGILNASYLGPVVPLTSDAEFHRRIYLDLVGRGPTVEESESFFRRIETDPAARVGIREAVIDDLLNRSEFSRYYAKVLEVMFTERRENIGTLEFREVIRRWLAERRPLNELCMEILGADGTDAEFRAAAGFIVNRQADPNLVTRDIGRIFFGRDVQCAQCHDHPLVADYAQAEYFGILSFVNRTYLYTDEKRGNKPFLGEKSDGPLEYASVFRPDAPRSTAHPTLPLAMAMDTEPEFLNAEDAYVVVPAKDKRGVPHYSRRQQLAVLATHPENHAFNRNLANRLWAGMMGQGVVHPVDMHHSDNPPVSAALLRLLSEELVAGDYDLRSFLREIARSQAWQRSVVVPDLQAWPGPAGGLPALAQNLQSIAAERASLQPAMAQLDVELTAATARLQKAQATVGRQQQLLNEARKRLQELTEQRDKDTAKLAELRASPESPADQVDELQDGLEQLEERIEGQRSRILALANRKLALGEFVVEARGGERAVRTRIQTLLDAQADLDQHQSRIEILMRWLEQRAALQQSGSAETAVVGERTVELDLREAELVESWRRSFAVRRLRPLNPEQLAGATYFGLEMHRAVARKATEEWQAKHSDNPQERDDAGKLQDFVTTALAVNQWDTVEDLVVTPFAAPPGAPQDAFFATVDQALMIQNDATFQGWLKVSDGNLLQRLESIAEPELLAGQLYLSVLGRLPVPEETAMVRELLERAGAERSAVTAELVWGLLASSEFRFSM